MEFRLTYVGELPSQQSKKSHSDVKRKIRLHLHTQLKKLWRINPLLIAMDQQSTASKRPDGYVPLIGTRMGTGCALDILLLRRDFPGNRNIIWHGDIDNRIKVLLDALKIPDKSDHATGGPDEGKNPFMCCLRMTVSSLI